MKHLIFMILAPSLTVAAFGGPQPGAPSYWYVAFNLERQAWHATDILIVNEGEKIDGKVMVEEVLHGSKAVGEKLEFPGLVKLADPKERTTYVPDPNAVRAIHTAPFPEPTRGFKPKVIPGSQIVLFLGGGGKEILVNYKSGTMRKPPKPDNIDEHPITRNVALIDGERLFAKTGRLDAPVIPVVELSESVKDLREMIAAILEGRERIRQCGTMEDTEIRAAEAVRLIDSSNSRIQSKGFEILFGCGTDAIPHIQAYLEKQGFDRRIALSLEQIRAAGWAEEPDLRPDEAFVPPLIYLAKRETEFWRSTLPTLKGKWWNEPDDGNRQRRQKLQNRAELTAKVVRALGAVRTPEALAKVAEIRDFSGSKTWLRYDMGGKGGGLYRTCLATLGELTAEKRRELDFGNPDGGR
ncbi:MAG: hypothetical protein ACON4R_08850 [Akkermansiaceae bacterium]